MHYLIFHYRRQAVKGEYMHFRYCPTFGWYRVSELHYYYVNLLMELKPELWEGWKHVRVGR